MMTDDNHSNINTHEVGPKTVAYLGDAVYELWVREYCIAHGSQHSNKLHKMVTGFVRANFQADLLNHLEEYLTETELDWVRRGKNLPLPSGRKLDVNTYRHATGFEVLIGYLYLSDLERLSQLKIKILAFIAS